MTLTLVCIAVLTPFFALGFTTLQARLERREYEKHFED